MNSSTLLWWNILNQLWTFNGWRNRTRRHYATVTSWVPYLWAVLGTASYTDQFVGEKIAQQVSEVSLLSAIAITQPHAAYAAFTHKLSTKWFYLSHMIPNMSRHFQHLENAIRIEFIPTLTGISPPNDTDHEA